MRRAAGDAIVGAAERPWALLNQVALFRILPVAHARNRPTGFHRAGTAQIPVRVKNRWRIGTLRHLRRGRTEALHVIVDDGRNSRTRLQDDDPTAFAQRLCNQRTGEAGTDDRDVRFYVGFGGHGWTPVKWHSMSGLRAQ